MFLGNLRLRIKTVQLMRGLALLHDMLWVPLALAMAYMVRIEFQLFTPAAMMQLYLPLLLICLPVQTVAFIYFGLYRGLWRFASVPDLMRILRAVASGIVITILILYVLRMASDFPRAVLMAYPVFLILGLTGPRLMYRWYKDHRQPVGGRKRALILGAGPAGDRLVRDLIKSRDYLPVGFLDDDPANRGRDIHGVRVFGGIKQLERRLRDLEIEFVLIAMPEAPPRLLRQVLDVTARRAVPCVRLPSLRELADGHIGTASLRELDIEDLLGRESVVIDDAGLHAFLQGRRVLITGAGGSIGSELCRQVRRYEPQSLIMLDHAEYGLYSIAHEMEAAGSSPGIDLVPVLGDVRDAPRMRRVFSEYRPDVVLHAAAYKHVPLVESNVVEGVRTNALGTRILADLAMAHGCERFVLVSTDKAVNPSNLMGASKRVAELYCQSLGGQSETVFIVTRFGNVLGSAGSVVPLFRKQIAAGGPVTVTHPEITRYFMTIPEAVSLILQSATMGKGGEIYVLDMGKPMLIRDLAEEMIRLSGHEPDRDIEIHYIGLRPGEKLHEELFDEAENPSGTTHPKIMQARALAPDRDWLSARMQELQQACRDQDEPLIRKTIRELVPGFIDPSPSPSPASRATETPPLKLVAGKGVQAEPR